MQFLGIPVKQTGLDEFIRFQFSHESPFFPLKFTLYLEHVWGHWPGLLFCTFHKGRERTDFKFYTGSPYMALYSKQVSMPLKDK